jgi:hypothetical protein
MCYAAANAIIGDISAHVIRIYYLALESFINIEQKGLLFVSSFDALFLIICCENPPKTKE